MPASPPAPVRSLRSYLPWVLAAVVALVYALGHLNWYLGTPLGRVPVLDERENLSLAEAIAGGALPAEPFYRAPGYALMLAAFRLAGVPAGGLFAAALLTGALLHATNAALVARITGIWFGRRAAMGAGVLFALHPVMVHYSTQALDAVPALTCFLAGLACIAAPISRGSDTARRHTAWLAASLCWAAAVLLRPNYFLVWLALPFLAWFQAPAGRLRRSTAALAGMLLFAAQTGWQFSICGVAGFLPWQGAYNFWAANQPGAHGRYYVQALSFPAEVAAKNPARAESIALYQRETGCADADVAAMNAYWRGRLIQRIVTQPIDWLAQVARRVYALLNDWEQYNNKTFAFHQARSPWLRWNRLSWGVLLVLATAGMLRLARANRRLLLPLALIAAAVAFSVLVAFVSARFRLPLAALAAILAGGALGAPRTCWNAARSAPLTAIAMLLFAAFIAFSHFDGVRDHRTFVQDHTLLARAAATVGDPAQSWQEARAALALQPTHPDALQLAITAYFDLLLAGTAPAAEEPVWQAACGLFLALETSGEPEVRTLAALGRWRAGEAEPAFAVWRGLGAFGPALAARRAAGDATVDPTVLASQLTWKHPLEVLVATRLGLRPPAGIPTSDSAQAAATLARVFTPAPAP